MLPLTVVVVLQEVQAVPVVVLHRALAEVLQLQVKVMLVQVVALFTVLMVVVARVLLVLLLMLQLLLVLGVVLGFRCGW